MTDMIVMISCPECSGEGYLETVTGIAADGDQIIAKWRCEKCDGTGEVEMDDEALAAFMAAAEEVMFARVNG